MKTDLYFPDYADASLRRGLARLTPCLDLVTCRITERGWCAHGYSESVVQPVRGGDLPFDGGYRGSWISPGICLVLHMRLPMIGDSLRAWLSANLADQVGPDGNLFEFGVDHSSQRKNVESAVKALADKIPVRFDE